LLIVGTGPLEPELRARSETARIPVTFAGFLNQTEIPAAYAAADCLVLPSDYGETWGLVVNEAMACGLPAIVSDRVGCGPDLVTNGETGFRFRFGNTEDLARRLEEMARLGEEGRRAIGERARERIIRAYSIEKAVANTVKATFEVIEQPGGGSRH
jgi:glycosyltransferase involved in cell wall biosynthesis